ncbi:unnamed protein product [Albugo candida]|uniref:F5/8 type C domain-containing protein n=1 Tax=Albugo candida TaxID=65357 RepID=A0A024G1Z4_9STRA|nr:unnamed protein product [Albugo candida]|eukprot:CCI40686.1 unnamed protein product [Albugo candida]
MELASDEEGAIIHSATSFDPTYPPSKILDGGQETKWVTTGSFPQEVILQFGNCSTISRIKTWTCNGLIEHEGNVQVEIEMVAAKEVTFLKFRIISGWSDFASVNRLSVEGSTSRR